jgi:hypothetical protein
LSCRQQVRSVYALEAPGVSYDADRGTCDVSWAFPAVVRRAAIAGQGGDRHRCARDDVCRCPHRRSTVTDAVAATDGGSAGERADAVGAEAVHGRGGNAERHDQPDGTDGRAGLHCADGGGHEPACRRRLLRALAARGRSCRDASRRDPRQIVPAGRGVREAPLEPCKVSPRRREAPGGLWRSLVAHLTGGQGVAGSNPVSPTVKALVRGTFGGIRRCLFLLSLTNASHNR